MYTENNEIPVREIKELKKERYIDFKTQHSKDANYSQVVYLYNVISLKIPARFSVAIDKHILKFIWKVSGPKWLKPP